MSGVIWHQLCRDYYETLLPCNQFYRGGGQLYEESRGPPGHPLELPLELCVIGQLIL